MVPTWAAVVVALGGSAVAAFAGAFGAYLGFRSSRLGLQHQTREAWRTRMIEATEDFLAAANAVSWSIRPLLFDDPAPLSPDFESALDRQWGELRRGQLRVDLIFGATSTASDRADDLVQMCRAGVAAVRSAGDADSTENVWNAQSLFMGRARRLRRLSDRSARSDRAWTARVA